MPINNNKLFLVLLSLTLSAPALAKVYKWTDASGVTHYTSTPPPAKIKVKNSQELKIHKTPKSSLTHKSKANTRYKKKSKFDRNDNQDSQNKEESIADKAHDKCQKAISNIPKVYDEVETLLKMGRRTRKLSDADYDKKITEIREQRRKIPTYSKCIDEYKHNNKERRNINQFADNDPQTILSMIMLEGAFKHVQKNRGKK